MRTEYTCIVCPVSCRVWVEDHDGELTIGGYGCKRGEAHARTEHTNPSRMLTSTVKIENAIFSRLPVISSGEIPKTRLRECLAEVYRTTVKAPVACHQVLIADICGTGIDILASRTMDANK